MTLACFYMGVADPIYTNQISYVQFRKSYLRYSICAGVFLKYIFADLIIFNILHSCCLRH